tara:strand:- start:277 stop:855 length:579 start_codon:yes stop_codon:yes gene_type:complete
MIGTIKTSILGEDDFNNEHENEEWVLMDGRDVSGSEYAQLLNKNNVPDARGTFLRPSGVGSALVGEIQDAALNNADLGFEFTKGGGDTISMGSHNHKVYKKTNGTQDFKEGGATIASKQIRDKLPADYKKGYTLWASTAVTVPNTCKTKAFHAITTPSLWLGDVVDENDSLTALTTEMCPVHVCFYTYIRIN